MRVPGRRAHAAPVHRAVPSLIAVLALGGVLATAGPAAADGALAPGGVTTIELAVPQTWSVARQVDVTVGRLVQAENGCLGPEERAGDDCTSEVGDLAGQLRATVALGVRRNGRCAPLAAGMELDLFGKGTTRLTTPAPGVDCLFVDLTFPDEDVSDNLAQSDTLSFPLALVARDFLATAPDTGAVGAEETPVPAGPPGDGTPGGGVPGGGVPGGGVPGGQAPGGAANGGVTDGGAAGGGAAGGRRPAGAGPAANQPPGIVVAAPADPGGPVLDRVDAEVSVGDGGVAVQTRSASQTVQSLVLAWASVLIGAVALGWTFFVLVLRRRRRKAEA